MGQSASSVNKVAGELGCDWHTVNDAVIAYGTALVDDDPERYGLVRALGLVVSRPRCKSETGVGSFQA